MPFLFQIDVYDPVAAAIVPLRMASDDDPALCHLDGKAWWPVVDRLPTLGLDFFGGEFGRVTTPASSLSLSIEPFAQFGRYSFPDARLRMWHGETGANWAGFTLRFDGRVTARTLGENGIAEIGFAVDDKWLDQPLLATYAGTGGIEGAEEKKGTEKPLALGAPLGVPGVLLDQVRSIFQLSAYGAVEGVDVPLERLARQFGPPDANYASYAALEAATVPAGQWATANAQGLVRHGAPPYGKICWMMRGDKAGVDGWVRKPGGLIKRIAELASGLSKTHVASLAALDVARPYNLSVYLERQTTAREIIQSLAASVNAVAGVGLTGQLFAIPVQINAAGLTLRADGSGLPIVSEVKRLGMAAPWWRQAIGARPFWLVHGQGDYATISSPEPGATNDANLRDPNQLLISEKIRDVIPKENARSGVNGRYPTVRARMVALGLPVAALDTASANWLTYRNGITDWNNISVHSTIVRTTWDALDKAFDDQLNLGDVAISQEDSRRAVVDGAGFLNGSGGVRVDNSYVAPGQNLIPNSDQSSKQLFFTRWNPDAINLPWGPPQWAGNGFSGWTTANYELAGNVKSAAVFQLGRVASPSYGFVDFDIDRGDGARWRTPCSPDEVMIASVYLATHRCIGRLYLTFEDAAGTIIQIASVDTTSPTENLVNRLGSPFMDRISLKRSAPAGAYTASIIVSKGNTFVGETDSYLWAAAPMLERAATNQQGPSPYMPGPPASVRQIGYTGDLDATLGAQLGVNTRRSNGTLIGDNDALNETMDIAVDVSGTGGRARVVLRRNGGAVVNNTVQLPSVVQNTDQQYGDINSLPAFLIDNRIPNGLESNGDLRRNLPAAIGSVQNASVIRPIPRGARLVTLRDGESYTFPQAWGSGQVPTVKAYNNGFLDATNYLDNKALNVTSSGFTADCKKVSPGTLTTQTETTLGTATSPRSVEIVKGITAEAHDDSYRFQFNVSVTNQNLGGGEWEAGSVTVGIWTNDGATWQLNQTVTVYGASTSGSTAVNAVQVNGVARDGMGLNDRFGLSIEASDFGGSISSFTHVKYETTSGNTISSATPANFPGIPFLIMGGTEN